jgi:hypothetical protein
VVEAFHNPGKSLIHRVFLHWQILIIAEIPEVSQVHELSQTKRDKIFTKVDSTVLFPSPLESMCLIRILRDVRLCENSVDQVGGCLTSLLIHVCYGNIPSLLCKILRSEQANSRPSQG